MAKIAFTKLGLTKNQEVKEWEYNGQIIEVKQYLPLSDKEDMAQWIAQRIVGNNETYLNEFTFRTYMDLAIVYYYTNISFTDKQREDEYKLYDQLVGSGFVKELRRQIDCDELDTIELYMYENINHYYEHRNSVYGIFENIGGNYDNLKLDVDSLQEKISNPESLTMVKDILTKMG